MSEHYLWSEEHHLVNQSESRFRSFCNLIGLRACGSGGGGGGVGGEPLRGWEVLCAGNKYADFRTLFYISCH